MSMLNQLSNYDLQRASGRASYTQAQIDRDIEFFNRIAWIAFRRFENVKVPILFGLWHKRLRDFEGLWTLMFGPEPASPFAPAGTLPFPSPFMPTDPAA